MKVVHPVWHNGGGGIQDFAHKKQDLENFPLTTFSIRIDFRKCIIILFVTIMFICVAIFSADLDSDCEECFVDALDVLNPGSSMAVL